MHSKMESENITALSNEEWKKQAHHHRQRLSPFIDNRLFIRTHGQTHPVYDFLFSYYSFSSGQLLRWSPGINVNLLLTTHDELDWKDFYRHNRETCFIDPGLFPERRIPFLNWALKFLKLSAKRPPVFHCFGLHEWAMLYRSEVKQHPDVPLRIAQKTLDELVQDNSLCCSHYDAFRFFTPNAKPLNKSQLLRETVPEHEQPGCIHANMDLYKLGYKIAPFISSDLLAELFIMARQCREIDMRASPYDISKYGFTSIPIETREGREQYVAEQRKLYIEAQNLRANLISTYEILLKAKTNVYR